ncbi:MAG: phosphomannomutase/phosphoglucomutase [Gammaproteobacteria bacterium]|nr:phosphomannomutase/phosphoglucomutase [Pseudomonadales bacterium]MCP5347626.1 phosphomannomutase/phosphoglucomutase [Pseudomonadales bacterium]
MSVTADPDSAALAGPVAPEIFRAYDIRGIYDDQLNEQSIELIGHAIGSEALDEGITALLVGRDGRLSSPVLSRHLIAGIRASGCNVVDLDLVPTPLVYFATHRTTWTSGVMLTASHNPAAYNGIKIVFRQSCLADNQIQRIRMRIDAGQLHRGEGGYQALDIKPDYLDYVSEHLHLQRSLKVVVDCGNAIPGLVAPLLFTRLGCQVIPLYCELDGNFPNHEPDPTLPENLRDLQAQVISQRADLGLAFDGDGDRLGVVTADGQAIDTDLLLATLISDIVPRHPGEPVIFDVKCSSRLAHLIESCGGIPVMHKSGHSFMKQKMQQTRAPLGGEYSAHIFIRDRWFGYDDGMYTAARLLEILSRDSTPSQQRITSLGERYASREIPVPVCEQQKFELIGQLHKAARFPNGRVTEIDGIRVDYADGWGLVRASNTSPALLLRFEADTPTALARIKGEFRYLLRGVDQSLSIDF